MAEYVDIEAVKLRLPECVVDDVTEQAEIDATLAEAIASASALVDRHLGETFEALAEEASARTYYGNGTEYLEIGAYDADEPIVAESVEMGGGYSTPDFVARPRHLVLSDASGVLRVRDRIFGLRGWPEGVPVTVTARWGEAVPGDVKEATMLLVAAMWRETYASASTDARQQAREDRAAAMRLLDRRLARLGVPA